MKQDNNRGYDTYIAKEVCVYINDEINEIEKRIYNLECKKLALIREYNKSIDNYNNGDE